MNLARRRPELAGNVKDLSAARELFELTNARLYLRFQPQQWGQRQIQAVAGGAIAFGSAEPPVVLYGGPTARKCIKDNRAACDAADPGDQDQLRGDYAGREGTSLGNVKSGRLDLNQRPLRPERSALARLSYAPCM
jgi:hypothetical protein